MNVVKWNEQKTQNNFKKFFPIWELAANGRLLFYYLLEMNLNNSVYLFVIRCCVIYSIC
jgi:hypothetical protein